MGKTYHLEKLVRLAKRKGRVDSDDVDAVLASNTDAVLVREWASVIINLVGTGLHAQESKPIQETESREALFCYFAYHPRPADPVECHQGWRSHLLSRLERHLRDRAEIAAAYCALPRVIRFWATAQAAMGVFVIGSMVLTGIALLIFPSRSTIPRGFGMAFFAFWCLYLVAAFCHWLVMRR